MIYIKIFKGFNQLKICFYIGECRYSFINHFLLIKLKIIIAIFFIFILITFFVLKITKKIRNYSKGKRFIEKCLINKELQRFDKIYNSPIFSVIIPIYNCEKTIHYPIISIQHQNISQIEIILINDFSNDNTSNVIQEMNIYDKRIKIINNKKNFGTLYSRCIGTLISKGEYIFCLDDDDMIFGEDIFDSLYKSISKEKYDILAFKSVNSKSYSEKIRKIKDSNSYRFPNNLIIHQPELSTWFILEKGEYNPHDVTLWGKIIKTSIYIEAINLLGKERYTTYISWAEDTCMNYIIFNIANSFKFIHKYGILHLISSSTASIKQSVNNKFFGELFLIDIIFDYSKNICDKKYSALAAIYTMKNYNKYKSTITRNNLLFFNRIILKIINSKNICFDIKYNLSLSFEKFLAKN